MNAECRCDDHTAESKQNVTPGMSTKQSLSSMSNKAGTAKSSNKQLEVRVTKVNAIYYYYVN